MDIMAIKETTSEASLRKQDRTQGGHHLHLPHHDGNVEPLFMVMRQHLTFSLAGAWVLQDRPLQASRRVSTSSLRYSKGNFRH
jgi:hypothetical protein